MSEQSDQELLELAAKAVGIEGDYKPKYFCGNGPNDYGIYIEATGWVWNPLTDDGDALRLAVKLGLSVDVMLCEEKQSRTISANDDVTICGSVLHNGDPFAATRRAIVCAAALLALNNKS